jgi:hypothetical protein
MREDPRIPPYKFYEHEDNRPYYDNTVLTFHLKLDEEPPDTLGNGSGAAGGTNGNGKLN